jgi:hypothetical protein
MKDIYVLKSIQRYQIEKYARMMKMGGVYLPHKKSRPQVAIS